MVSEAKTYTVEVILNDDTRARQGFHLGTKLELAKTLAQQLLDNANIKAVELIFDQQVVETFTKEP